MATAIFLMLSGNSMEFTSHTVEGDTYQACLGKVLTELDSPCMWEVYDHEVVKGGFETAYDYYAATQSEIDYAHWRIEVGLDEGDVPYDPSEMLGFDD